MPRPRPVPDALRGTAFDLRTAAEHDITPRMLEHPRFVQVFPRVYIVRGTVLSPRQRIEAARLTLPDDAITSHHTRLLELGLDLGEPNLHFTVGRDHHIATPGIVLHRTRRLPPHDGRGVDPAGALVGLASLQRPLDVIGALDWLLHRHLLRASTLASLVRSDEWRPGTVAARRALELSESRSRSLPESAVRVLLVAAGLPAPESNVELYADDGTFVACVDHWYRELRLALEYEGWHHATDPEQFHRDIGRFGRLRERGDAYVQITSRDMAQPRATVLGVHRAMVARGYSGPAPDFGAMWSWMLETPAPLVHRASGPRRLARPA